MSGEQRLSDFDKGYEAGYRDAARAAAPSPEGDAWSAGYSQGWDEGRAAGPTFPPAPDRVAGLLDRFIETAEGPVLVMDGNHVRGPATAFELDLRAALIASNRPGLDVERLARAMDHADPAISEEDTEMDRQEHLAYAREIAAEYARLGVPDDE